MNELVTSFIGHIAQCFTTYSSRNLITSLPLDGGHPFFGPLRQALSGVAPNTTEVSSIVPQLRFISPEIRDNLANFISAILENIRGDTNYNGGPKDENERAYEEFSRLQRVYCEANKLYGMTNQDGQYIHAFLNPLILILAKNLVKVSSRAASLSTLPLRHPKSARSIRDATRQVIERSNQIATSNMTESEWNEFANSEHLVGDTVWGLANVLFRIYSERKLHTQSTELQKTLDKLLPREEKRLTSRGHLIPQTEVCQSYYWRGKLGVVLMDMRRAEGWLDRAWAVCPDDKGAWKQRRAILIRLIPIKLLRGKIPRPSLLQEYDLPEFQPLIHAYRTGNIPLWRRTLERSREWFRRRSVWLILYERGEILVWRNLFKQALKIHYNLDPTAAKNRCPTSIFISAAHQAFANSGELEDGSIGLEDIIVVISSLIDQSLILGHLSYSQKQLVMKPSDDGMGGFPKISIVTPRAVQAIA
ncbi:hypothetical protein CI109_102344 [Kwoniella shandongensis]|uniref:Uncharacterized protein n=1 Tax=Kwoniella shandongensis TaxID=1734106 RepID=A0A5M6BZX7_9TREE|nr:uncharacterized protein CI109_003337 [Kwoniella shandongensis]KAA5528437.1 hypothetical protein CI109_003337 [Kwoniella shandongensis]